MSDKTSIAWADSTWNPWIGCTKVSPGCANCYAADYGRRFGVEWGPGKKRRRTSAAYWRKPLAWNKQFICDCGGTRTAAIPFTKGPQDQCSKCAGFNWRKRRIFPSLCDPFDPEVPIEWLADMLDLIRRTPNLTWLLLTKRPEQWLERVTHAIGNDLRHEARGKEFNDWLTRWANGHAPANVWLGVSAEDQERWDERVPVLLSIPAAKRFVSVEPMLGPIDMGLRHGCRSCNHPGNIIVSWNEHGRCSRCDGTGHEPSGIDWVIFGGESGPKARPCNVDWIRDGLRQCREAGVACFTKQLGAHVIDNDCVSATAFPRSQCWPSGVEYHESDRRIILRDPKGADPSEWPADLRVREVTE